MLKSWVSGIQFQGWGAGGGFHRTYTVSTYTASQHSAKEKIHISPHTCDTATIIGAFERSIKDLLKPIITPPDNKRIQS